MNSFLDIRAIKIDRCTHRGVVKVSREAQNIVEERTSGCDLIDVKAGSFLLAVGRAIDPQN